ncbi:Werner Syndrome-like exonuclease, partial [Bienertia sinuspersici]
EGPPFFPLFHLTTLTPLYLSSPPTTLSSAFTASSPSSPLPSLALLTYHKTPTNPPRNSKCPANLLQIVYPPLTTTKSTMISFTNQKPLMNYYSEEQLLIDYDLNVKHVVYLGNLLQKIAVTKKGMGLKDLSRFVLGVEILKPKNVALSRWIWSGELVVQKIVGVKRGAWLKELSKVVLRLRWNFEWLSCAQIQYACIDAFLSFWIAHTLIPLLSIN